MSLEIVENVVFEVNRIEDLVGRNPYRFFFQDLEMLVDISVFVVRYAKEG